jgi:hypothetical protein
MMASADEVVSNITLHFPLLKSAVAMKCGRQGMVRIYYGQTRRLWTWVLGYAFENLLGMEILSKNALILRKKKIYSIPTCAFKIPLHVAQIPLQKWGI